MQWKCSAVVVQWCSGAVVQWCSGSAVVQWCSGSAVQWCSGSAVQWCSAPFGRCSKEGRKRDLAIALNLKLEEEIVDD